jgi:hypothetical protein
VVLFDDADNDDEFARMPGKLPQQIGLFLLPMTLEMLERFQPR